MRNFPDFLTAYMEYAKDNYCPDSFHLWTGLSVLGGVCERKIWVRRKGLYYYPNLFILLISHPGMGKSSALNVGVDFIEWLHRDGEPFFNVVPNQITEAMFIELMEGKTTFPYKDKVLEQSSGYYYASEASASLKNLFGDFLACITDFYDCPKMWRKQIKSRKEPIILENVCFSLIAGSTFDYLRKLVNEENVMGGFASRLTYVVWDEKKARDSSWDTKVDDKRDPQMRQKLYEDLKRIHAISGPFKSTPEFQERWVTWFEKYDKELQNYESERLRALMVRQPNLIIKTAMLCSISESDELILNESHWERSMEIVQGTMAAVPKILTEAIISSSKSITGCVNSIMYSIEKLGGKATKPLLIDACTMKGYSYTQFNDAFESLLGGGRLKNGGTIKGESVYELIGNANRYI